MPELGKRKKEHLGCQGSNKEEKEEIKQKPGGCQDLGREKGKSPEKYQDLEEIRKEKSSNDKDAEK